MRIILRNQKQIASTIPTKKIIFIDPDKFYRKIKNYNIRVFILLHELAHLFTPNQKEADTIALQMYYHRGYPMRDAIHAITEYIYSWEGIERGWNLFNECNKLYNEEL